MVKMMSGQMVKTQSAARTTAHGGVDRGRSHDGDQATSRGWPSDMEPLLGDGEPMEQSGSKVEPEDWGGADLTRDRGGAGGMEEPAEAIGVERQSAAEGSQVRKAGRVMTDQSGAGGMREPGGAEGRRSQGEPQQVDGVRWSKGISRRSQGIPSHRRGWWQKSSPSKSEQ